MSSTLNQDVRAITESDVARFTTAVSEHLDKRTYKRIDTARALQLRIKKRLTYEEIAEEMGHDYKNVYQSINKFLKFLEDPGSLYAYQENKPDLLETMELKLLSYLFDLLQDKKTASVKDVANALKVVHEIGRLEKGQSTENVSMLLKSIEEAHKDPLNTQATPCPPSNSSGSLTAPVESSTLTSPTEPTKDSSTRRSADSTA